MNFNDLIKGNNNYDNEVADQRDLKTKELYNKTQKLFDSLDKDMLRALSMFGKHIGFYNEHFVELFKGFGYSDGYSKVAIWCSDDRFEDLPLEIIIKSGADAIVWVRDTINVRNARWNSYYVRLWVDFDDHYYSTDTEPIWIDTDFNPKERIVETPIVPKKKLLKMTTPRMVGDHRDWFETVEDALPKITAEFKDYLTKRMKGETK